MTINEKQLKIEHRRFVEDVTGRIRDFKNGKYRSHPNTLQYIIIDEMITNAR